MDVSFDQRTKVESYFRKICDNERKSRQRNEQILRDLTRFESQTVELSRKSQLLAATKTEYEAYLERKYPLWKERALQRINESSSLNDTNLRHTSNPDIDRESLHNPSSNGVQQETDIFPRDLNQNKTKLLTENNNATNGTSESKIVTNDTSHSNGITAKNKPLSNGHIISNGHTKAPDLMKKPATSNSVSKEDILNDNTAGKSVQSKPTSVIQDNENRKSSSSKVEIKDGKSNEKHSDNQSSKSKAVTDNTVKPESNFDINHTSVQKSDTNLPKSDGASGGKQTAKSTTTSSGNSLKIADDDRGRLKDNKSSSPRSKLTKSKSKTGRSPRSAVGAVGVTAAIVGGPSVLISSGIASPRNSLDVSLNSLSATPRNSMTVHSMERDSEAVSPRDSVDAVSPRGSFTAGAISHRDLFAAEAISPRGSLAADAISHSVSAVSPRGSVPNRTIDSHDSSTDAVVKPQYFYAEEDESSPRHSVDSKSSRGQKSRDPYIDIRHGSEDVHDQLEEKDEVDDSFDFESSRHEQSKEKQKAISPVHEMNDHTEVDDVSEFESDLSLTNIQPAQDPLSSLTLSANHTPAYISMPNHSESTMKSTAQHGNGDLMDDDWDDISGLGKESFNSDFKQHVPSKVASLTQSSAYRQLLADVTSSREGGVGGGAWGGVGLNTDTETEDEIEKNLKSHQQAHRMQSSLMATLNSTADSNAAGKSRSESPLSPKSAQIKTPRSSRSVIQSIAEDSDLEDDLSPHQSLSYLAASKHSTQRSQQLPPGISAVAAVTAKAIADDDDFWDD